MALKLRLTHPGEYRPIEYVIVNPEDVPRGRYSTPKSIGRQGSAYPLYAFQFGAYGTTNVLVWGDSHISLEDALEIAAGWLADNAPGLLIDDKEMANLYEEAKKEDPNGDEDSWRETAETDLTYTESGYIPSWEWYVNELHPGNPLYSAAFTASRAGNQLED